MRYLGAFLVAVLLAGSAHAQETFVFANGKVSLILPDKFIRMPKEIVEKRYPRGITPQHVFANEKMTVAIAMGYTAANDLTIDQLPQLKEHLEKTLERNTPGLQWITRDLTEINGSKWVHLEFQSNAFDTEIRNRMLMTALDNGMVSLNFNSTVGDFLAYKAMLERSQRSLKIKP